MNTYLPFLNLIIQELYLQFRLFKLGKVANVGGRSDLLSGIKKLYDKAYLKLS